MGGASAGAPPPIGHALLAAPMGNAPRPRRPSASTKTSITCAIVALMEASAIAHGHDLYEGWLRHPIYSHARDFSACSYNRTSGGGDIPCDSEPVAPCIPLWPGARLALTYCAVRWRLFLDSACVHFTKVHQSMGRLVPGTRIVKYGHAWWEGNITRPSLGASPNETKTYPPESRAGDDGSGCGPVRCHGLMRMAPLCCLIPAQERIM